MLTLSRPAQIESSEQRLDSEYRSARWTHHRLLDFEDEHQRVLAAAAELIAPGITRIGRILNRLARRARWAERATEGSWRPNPRAELAQSLTERLKSLREIRNADPRWKVACGWADEQVGPPKKVRRRRAKPANKIKRRKSESDEGYAKRFALLSTDETDEHYAAKLAALPRRTRRETFQNELYAKRSIYWGTWNALVHSVEQARKAVLKRRREGLPAEWRRPKWRDPNTLSVEGGGIRLVNTEGIWWAIDLRLGTGKGKSAEWVRMRAKCGNWHEFDIAKIRTAELTRRPDGARWKYNLSLAIEGVEKPTPKGEGRVAFDWGHREHGHDRQGDGIRAFTWTGDDDQRGEVLIPTECRQALDEIDTLKSRIDEAFNARRAAHRLSDRNRFAYRRRLMLSGVRTEEQSAWLRWEMRYERRIIKRRKRIDNLRREAYIGAIRKLRDQYSTFVFEAEAGWSIRKLQSEHQMRHRARSNRDLTARYEFVALCERFGAAILTVPARNSTRECPEPGCGGLLAENGPELLVVCPKCGTVRDKDYGAASVILRRAEEALADHAAE